MNLDSILTNYRSPLVSGRYVTLEDIGGVLKNLGGDFKIETQGFSVEDKPIKSVEIGTGSTRILMWSQMHGNEATTTKAVVDLLTFLNSDENLAMSIREYFTLLIIPILNPDGAEKYTRVNANEVDLNRDSVDLSQPESRCLRDVFEEFRPDYAFNLHDQRTIFAAGKAGESATISFLAPSYNEAREVNECRLEAMKLIAAMNKELQKTLPNKIGRFDDSFNLNCVGDCFQYLGVPTILFEAGHFPRDYEREVTRREVFRALLTVFINIISKDYRNLRINDYIAIPENEKTYRDVLFTNVSSGDFHTDNKDCVLVQYKEVLVDKIVSFVPIIVAVNEIDDLRAHLVVDTPMKWKVKGRHINELIDENLSEMIDLGRLSVNELLKK